SIAGCDSIIELHLHVNDTFRDVIYDTICRSEIYRGHGIYIIPSATVRDTFRIRRIILPTGCDSTIEVRVHVNDTFRTIVYDTICRSQVYSNHGITCTPSASVHDTLLINRIALPTGCDSVVELYLHVKDTFRTFRFDTICAGQTFYFENTTYNTSQTFVYRYTGINNCDSNVVVNLHVNDTLRDTVARIICAGSAFDTNGQSYTLPGLYTQHLRDPQSGCFRNLVIDLTVNDTIRDTIYRTVCAGASFDTNGQSYHLQGVYTQYQRNQQSGCFNNLVIFLNVNDTIRDTVEYGVCAGQTWTVNSQTYSADGWYRQEFRTPDGCDSILHLHLIVADTIRDTLFYSVCAGKTIMVNDVEYASTGWYRQSMKTPSGCDSILHINLNVEDTLRGHIYDTICYGNRYSFNGSIYSSSGTYRYATSTPQGCDSIAILHLYVNDSIMVHVYDTLCANDTYDFFGTVLNRKGTYYHQLPRAATGCDSTIALHLYVRDSIKTMLYDTICNNTTFAFGDTVLNRTGRYWQILQSYTGCDSMLCLNLHVLDFPTLTLVDTGGNCQGNTVTITAHTNANHITWTSFPTDSSLFGQEHNMVIVVSPTRYTEYVATVEIQPYNCFSSEVISLHRPVKLQAKMAASQVPITTDNLQTTFTDVSLGNVVSRKWMFHEDNPTAADRTYTDSIVYYTPTQESDSLEVTLMVTNNFGCHDTVVNIYPILKGDIWVPNAFTPGTQGTGNNYLFRVGHNNVTEYEISIYSRAGLLVFHSTDPDVSWDGTHNYKDCVGGSYVYIIRYKTNKHPGQSFEKKGSVMLIR
ncbi:MAG: gliding motility-associated C-terminal domain-containing protein, partial [Bacteroidales bacterium]|nr:gliding motility-associated C-terminal domain-containing protein [Bacteroidales bacterium]